MKTNPTDIISLKYEDMFHEVFQLFYLAKMYDEDLRIGRDYSRLKKCISIGILDFKLLESESYHSVYRLRNEKGEKETDLQVLGKWLRAAARAESIAEFERQV